MPHFKSKIGDPSFISLDHICNLLTITTTKDSLGQYIRSEKADQIFCAQLSITRSEFYTAGMLGLKPEKLLIVDSESYDQQQILEFEGIKYSIYKNFMRSDGFTELYCQVRSGD